MADCVAHGAVIFRRNLAEESILPQCMLHGNVTWKNECADLRKVTTHIVDKVIREGKRPTPVAMTAVTHHMASATQ